MTEPEKWPLLPEGSTHDAPASDGIQGENKTDKEQAKAENKEIKTESSVASTGGAKPASNGDSKGISRLGVSTLNSTITTFFSTSQS